ncbi:MAG: 30S ribosome-binding factor RbfA [Cytophagales bacterium]|nr:30S ribosome-binding factor RbfA [Cytophagales bacterium]
MQSKRQQKYSRQIQKDLGHIFQFEAKELFGKPMITVTEVEMSPDLSVAKVFLSFLLADDDKALLQQINAHKSEIRKHLGLKIGKQVRIVPELVFLIDTSQEHAANIDNILSGLHIPKEDKVNPDDYTEEID